MTRAPRQEAPRAIRPETCVFYRLPRDGPRNYAHGLPAATDARGPKGSGWMKLRRFASLWLMAMTFAACASMSEEERARSARVKIVTSADVVRECQPLGSVTEDDMQDLQRRAARLGGDVALVTSQLQGAKGRFSAYGGGSRYVTYTTAEVYRCEGAR